LHNSKHGFAEDPRDVSSVVQPVRQSEALGFHKSGKNGMRIPDAVRHGAGRRDDARTTALVRRIMPRVQASPSILSTVGAMVLGPFLHRVSFQRRQARLGVRRFTENNRIGPRSVCLSVDGKAAGHEAATTRSASPLPKMQISSAARAYFAFR
jgi:hypothetical protein